MIAGVREGRRAGRPSIASGELDIGTLAAQPTQDPGGLHAPGTLRPALATDGIT